MQHGILFTQLNGNKQYLAMPDSERLSISLPKGVHRKLEKRAKDEERNISSMVASLVERMLLQDENNSLWIEAITYYKEKAVEEKQSLTKKIVELETELDALKSGKSRLDLALPMVIKSSLLKSFSGETLSDLELSLLCDFFGYDQELVQKVRDIPKKEDESEQEAPQ